MSLAVLALVLWAGTYRPASAACTPTWITCPGTGNFADSCDCTIYHISGAGLGTGTVMKCPTGLYFHPTGKFCDRPANVKCGCTPSCSGKQCGSDGCGASCGTCAPGSTCSTTGQCLPAPTFTCSGKPNGFHADPTSCAQYHTCSNGVDTVRTCPSRLLWNCAITACDWPANVQCGNGTQCTRQCSGKQCGGDGCGGSCGSCPTGRTCSQGSCCTPSCAGKGCGGDGCGGSCGTCAAGSACTAAGQCVRDAFNTSVMPWDIYDACAANPTVPTMGGQVTTCVNGYCNQLHGQCVCADGWTGKFCQVPPGGQALGTSGFQKYLMRLPTGVTTHLTATYYGGGYEAGSCGYKICPPGTSVGTNGCTVPLPLYTDPATGVTSRVNGVAAVNTMVYGPQSGAGYAQPPNGRNGCGACYRLTRGTTSVTVAVVDRCGGGCWATSGQCTTKGASSVSGDCNWCLEQYCSGSATGNPWKFNSALGTNFCQPNRVCSEYNTSASRAAGGAESGLGGLCPEGVIPDWCQANDHPHFDLDSGLIDGFCGKSQSSFCQFDDLQPIPCVWDGFSQTSPVAPTGQ